MSGKHDPDLNKEWLENLELNLDEGEFHCDPSDEMFFYRAVAAGQVETVRQNCEENSFGKMEGFGMLSEDPITNIKYHFVVASCMITRFCAEGGMPMEEAYSLSDFYIRRMDRLKTHDSIVELHDRMAIDFTVRMKDLKKHVVGSKQVSDAVDYIYAHIYERITVDDMAKAICISPAYLSRIFKQAMGVSVSEYIRDSKIDVAKNLLCFSDHSLVDIANMLAFSSQSHFIQQFRSRVGVTPKAYRDNNYMKNWDVNRDAAEEE